MSSHAPTHLPSDVNSPVRLFKACAVCRRDKTKCDGNRPCGNCVKKGMNDDCIDAGSETPLPGSSPTVAGSITRRRASVSERAKLACQACRRDNKKCSDERPCPRCVSRGEECIHVERGPKVVKARCEQCRSENKKCEDARPCKYCVQQNKECLDMPRRGKGHGTRVKAACTNCRHNKIRCDGNRPCAPCARKSLQCVDRACRACTQAGKELECTHRKGQEPAESEFDDVDSPTLSSGPSHQMFRDVPSTSERIPSQSPGGSPGYPYLPRQMTSDPTSSYFEHHPTQSANIPSPQLRLPPTQSPNPSSYIYPQTTSVPPIQIAHYDSNIHPSMHPQHMQPSPQLQMAPHEQAMRAYAQAANATPYYQTPLSTPTSIYGATGTPLDSNISQGIQSTPSVYHGVQHYYELKAALAEHPFQPPGSDYGDPSNEPYPPANQDR